MALGTAMLIMGGASLVTSAYAQWKAGEAEQAQGEALKRVAEKQAQLVDYNAAVAELQAKDALERGEVDAHRFRTRTRQVVGEQRTQFAAGNIDVGYGSAVDVQADATFLGELDALTIKNNAVREAWGYRVEAIDLKAQTQILRTEGANALLAGQQRQSAARLGAIGTTLGGTASLLGTRYGFSRSQGKTDGGGRSSGDAVFTGDALRGGDNG